MKSTRKRPKKLMSVGGVHRGMSDVADHLMPQGYAKNIENKFFWRQGLKTRYGWEHITTGLTASNVWTWDESTKDLGAVVAFAQSDDGKILVFDKRFYYDADGTTEDFVGGGSTAADASQDFIGGFYFAGTFYVYSEEKLYSINMGTGAKTEIVDFGDDIGTDYDTVKQMIFRYGQMWALNESGRVFFSDTGVVSVAAESQVSNQIIDSVDLDGWQYVRAGILSSMDTVQYRTTEQWSMRDTDGYDAKRGDTFCYINGETGDLSDGDVVYVGNKRKGFEKNTVASVAAVNNQLQADAAAGDRTIKLVKDADRAYQTYDAGDEITIDDNVNSETLRIANYDTKTDHRLITLDGPLANSYTAATPTNVLHSRIVKVTVDDAWDNNYGKSSKLREEVWANLTEDTDYVVSLDPMNDDDAEGHIKLLSTQLVVEAEAIRCTYTPKVNYWLQGNSGFFDVGFNYGKAVEMVDTEAGLYVFKKNPGAIYLVTGAPGPNGSQGSLVLKKIHEGITALPGTIQASRRGVYFSALDIDKIRTYLLPLVNSEVDKIPELTEDYSPPITNVGNSSKGMVYRSAIVHNDMYLLHGLSQSGTDVPDYMTYMYLCQAYYDPPTHVYKGRWAKWTEDHSEVYEDDNSTHTVTGKPITLGFYEMNGYLFRVYIVHDSDDSGDTEFNYNIARYGYKNAQEGPQDKLELEIDSGSTANSIVSKSIYHRIKTRKAGVGLLDKFNVLGIYYMIEATKGDMDLSVYKDFGTTAIVTDDVDSLTDTAGSEQVLRYKKLNYNCMYTQFDMLFKNVYNASAEEHIIFNDILIEYSPLAWRGNLSEGDV
jgi:hypothetical protein